MLLSFLMPCASVSGQSTSKADFKQALAFKKDGIAYYKISNWKKARISFEKSANLLFNLLKTEPNNGDYLLGLSMTCIELGKVQLELKNDSVALKYHAEANKILTRLYENEPQNLNIINSYSISFLQLGNTHCALKNDSLALEFYTRNLDLCKILLDKEPKNLNFKNGVGVAHSKLGLLRGQNNTELARKDFKEAERIYLELVRDASTEPSYNASLKEVQCILQNWLK